MKKIIVIALLMATATNYTFAIGKKIEEEIKARTQECIADIDSIYFGDKDSDTETIRDCVKNSKSLDLRRGGIPLLVANKLKCTVRDIHDTLEDHPGGEEIEDKVLILLEQHIRNNTKKLFADMPHQEYCANKNDLIPDDHPSTERFGQINTSYYALVTYPEILCRKGIRSYDTQCKDTAEDIRKMWWKYLDNQYSNPKQ